MPKIFLVAQQAEAIREWVGKVDLVVAEYYGKLSFPEIGSFDVLVSTPEAFRMRQKTKEGLRWSSICLLVFDEVHHVLKDDPYRKIALDLKRHRSVGSLGTEVQIVGLTAMLTYAVTPAKIKASKERLCQELAIEAMPNINHKGGPTERWLPRWSGRTNRGQGSS